MLNGRGDHSASEEEVSNYCEGSADKEAMSLVEGIVGQARESQRERGAMRGFFRSILYLSSLRLAFALSPIHCGFIYRLILVNLCDDSDLFEIDDAE